MPSQALGIATLIAWCVTAGIGGFMLRGVIVTGGLREQRKVRNGLHPGVLVGHFTLALTGLVIWVSYVATGLAALAWVAVCLLGPAIGLGLSTVTLWTPYPDFQIGPPGGPGPPTRSFPGGLLASPAEDALGRKTTDETLVSAMTDQVLMNRLIEEVVAAARSDPARAGKRPQGPMAALIPFTHGLGAVTTFVLAVVAAAIGS
jgi:hypothetical protein